MVLAFSIFFTLNFFINDNAYYGFGTNIIGSFFENSSLNKIQSNFQTIFLGAGFILSLICWKKNILNKEKEKIWFVGKKVIKYFENNQITKKRIKRSKITICGKETNLTGSLLLT